MEYSNERIKKLIEDASYLIDETEALRFVIGNIPVYERPPEGESFFDLIASIDQAQKSYFRPFIQGLVNLGVDFRPPSQYARSYRADDPEKEKMDNLIDRISKSRAGLMAFLDKVSFDDMRTEHQISGRSYSIAGLLEEMIRFERQQLKKAAEMILTMEKPGGKP